MKAPNRNVKDSQTTVEFLLGPIKIKDGLFIGDQFAAKVTPNSSRTSNSLSAIKWPMSSILSLKASQTYTNASAFSIFLCIGRKRKKTYSFIQLDLWQKEQCPQGHILICGGGDVAGGELSNTLHVWQKSSLCSSGRLHDEEVQLVVE